MEQKDLLLEMYKIAIEGYHNHFERYNHWMNMYAIFNGALFIGLYNIIGKDVKVAFSDEIEFFLFLQLLILALGCISSWFWFFSSRGFYRWNISWIETVAHHERKFVQRFIDDESKEDIYVYNIFRKIGNEKYFMTRPFSTQKITQWFTATVAVAWSAITILFLLKNHSELGCLSTCASAVLIVVVVLACGFWLCRESDLEDSHLVV